MGYLAVDYSVLASNTREFVVHPVGSNIILGLSLIVLEDITNSTDLWVEIGLMSGGATLDQRAAVLANGYAGTANSVFWTGFIPTGDDAQIYALVEAGAGDAFRLSALLAPSPHPIPVGVPSA